MFKSSKKRESNRLSFEQQLNQRLNLIKQEPILQKANKNKQIIAILDQVVDQLQTPKQNTPHKQPSKQVNQCQYLPINQNSSISLNSKIEQEQSGNINRKKKEHISILVSNSEIVKLLMDNYANYLQGQKIGLQNFIKKVYTYYLGITVKEQQLPILKNKIKVELTTTDPQYLSLNALQIVAKKTNLKHYFQSIFIETKIQQHTNQLQKKNKKILHQLSEKQRQLKEKEFRLNYSEEEYQTKSDSLMNKEKIFNQKVKEFNQRQKQLKKNIEQKTMKLYQSYLLQFTQKIKEAQKRLVNTQKNLKYKIEILERRAQSLRTLLSEKNDLKNKKIANENESKVRIRKLQRQMEQLQKKHQAEIDLFEKQQKDLMKSNALLEEKLAKSQKKCTKYKQKIAHLQEELLSANQNIQQLTQKLTQAQSKFQQQHQPKMEIQSKTLRQKTNRSQRNKKKYKQLDFNILSLYEIVLQGMSNPNRQSHSQHQQIINRMMTNTIKQVPRLIQLLTYFEDEHNLYRQPHYLVMSIAKTIIGQFYFLRSSEQEGSSNIAKLKSADVEELLKYPYHVESRFSILLLFIQIYDWNEPSSARFFAKTIDILIEQVQRRSILSQNNIKEHQIKLLISHECVFFMVSNFYQYFINKLQSIQKDSSPLCDSLLLVIAISDLLVCLVKVPQNCIFDQLNDSKLQKIVVKAFVLVLQSILYVYSSFEKSKGKSNTNKIRFESVESLQELAEKLSIFIQRYYYKYPKSLSDMPLRQKITSYSHKLRELNKINGNRHCLMLANIKSIEQMGRQYQ